MGVAIDHDFIAASNFAIAFGRVPWDAEENQRKRENF
jgi:hypothetical protein